MRVGCLKCGAGGFALGSIRAGGTVVASWDDDPDAVKVFDRNFPEANASAPCDLTDFAHPDVIVINDDEPKWVRSTTLTLMPRVVCVEGSGADWLHGYKKYRDVLRAEEFGLPQRRVRKYVVAFRNDIKPLFYYFPFPDVISGKTPIGQFLDERRDDLVVPPDVLAGIISRRKKNLARGWRSTGRIVRPSDRLMDLSPRYASDKTSFLIDQGYGPRRLSLEETKRIMGFPDYFSMPVTKNKAIRLLASSICPPVAHALMTEVKQWLF